MWSIFLIAQTSCWASNPHDDVIKWKHFPRYWPFVRGIHRWPHKGQWRGALMFSLICAWINGSVNNREAGDLRRHRAHYDVIVMVVGGLGRHDAHMTLSCWTDVIIDNSRWSRSLSPKRVDTKSMVENNDWHFITKYRPKWISHGPQNANMKMNFHDCFPALLTVPLSQRSRDVIIMSLSGQNDFVMSFFTW